MKKMIYSIIYSSFFFYLSIMKNQEVQRGIDMVFTL